MGRGVDLKVFALVRLKQKRKKKLLIKKMLSSCYNETEYVNALLMRLNVKNFSSYLALTLISFVILSHRRFLALKLLSFVLISSCSHPSL